jgi:SAM-dependent methyltransferase
VVDRYHLRPAYPPETFTILNELIGDEPRVVLDVGCGTGNVARPLAEYVERIDAVDLSLPMLERAKTLPGGDSAKIRWVHGRAEEAAPGIGHAAADASEVQAEVLRRIEQSQSCFIEREATGRWLLKDAFAH